MKTLVRLFISVFVFMIFYQNGVAFTKSDSIIVFSVSGKVNLLLDKNFTPLKSYDVLRENAVLIFDKKSKIFYIDPNKKLYIFEKAGKYKIKDILAARNPNASEYGKALELVIHHFIEHGKVISDEKKYTRVGATFRGDDDKWIIFPGNQLNIFQNATLTPQVNSKVLDVKKDITAYLIKNDEIIKTVIFKPGESIFLGQFFENDAEYFLRITAGQFSSVTEINITQQADKKIIESDLVNLRNSFDTSSISAYMLAEALYFDSRHFQIDAINDFEKLIKMDPSNEYYKTLLNNCIEGINVN